MRSARIASATATIAFAIVGSLMFAAVASIAAWYVAEALEMLFL